MTNVLKLEAGRLTRHANGSVGYVMGTSLFMEAFRVILLSNNKVDSSGRNRVALDVFDDGSVHAFCDAQDQGFEVVETSPFIIDFSTAEWGSEGHHHLFSFKQDLTPMGNAQHPGYSDAPAIHMDDCYVGDFSTKFECDRAVNAVSHIGLEAALGKYQFKPYAEAQQTTPPSGDTSEQPSNSEARISELEKKLETVIDVMVTQHETMTILSDRISLFGNEFLKTTSAEPEDEELSEESSPEKLEQRTRIRDKIVAFTGDREELKRLLRYYGVTCLADLHDEYLDAFEDDMDNIIEG